MVLMGNREIVFAVATPPFEHMMCNSARISSVRNARSRLSTYSRTNGPINAFMAAVVNRSNSRNWGETSLEVVTKASGHCSLTMAFARSS